MANYTTAGVHAIRGVIWDLLQSELSWAKVNYGGLVPILTPQQQPEVNSRPYPYIVYNYSQQMGGTDYWLNEETASFVIYSGSPSTGEDDIRKTLNVIRDHFKGFDDSAKMVNDWVTNSPNSNNEYKKFDYKWVRVVSTLGAGPSTEEGGRQSGAITLRYVYTYFDPALSVGEGRANLARFD